MDIVGTVTAPARISVRFALWGARTVGGLLPVGNGGEPAAPGPIVEEPPAPPETVARPAPPAPAPAPTRAPEPPEPAHVDEGATVVAEFAEGGAEDGAGAQVELAEPWEGYDRLHADELVDRLTGASSETLAAVLLYERSTRDRSSVVDASEQQLRRQTPPGPA
jgi:two-component system sensor histidine kinase and response regulator WspE